MLIEIIKDLSARFKKHQRKSFSLCSLLPNMVTETTWEVINDAVEKYAQFLDPVHSLIVTEFKHWR